MKNILAIVLLFYYVSLSVVNIISMHYCHGKLQTVEFSKISEDCCGTAHLNHNKCCKDIKIKVDFKVDQLFSPTLSIKYFKTPIDFSILVPTKIELLVNSIYPVLSDYPPGIKLSKLFKSHHSFLFYG